MNECEKNTRNGVDKGQEVDVCFFVSFFELAGKIYSNVSAANRLLKKKNQRQKHTQHCKPTMDSLTTVTKTTSKDNGMFITHEFRIVTKKATNSQHLSSNNNKPNISVGIHKRGRPVKYKPAPRPMIPLKDLKSEFTIKNRLQRLKEKLEKVCKSEKATFSEFLDKYHNTRMGYEQLKQQFYNFFKHSTMSERKRIKKHLDIGCREFTDYYLYSKSLNFFSDDRLENFRLQTMSDCIPSTKQIRKMKNMYSNNAKNFFEFQRTKSGWRVSLRKVLQYIIEEREKLGFFSSDLRFKIAIDGTPLKDGVVVASVNPIDISYYPSQSVLTSFPICVFTGSEDQSNINDNILKFKEEVKSINGTKMSNCIIDFLLVCDLKSLGCISNLYEKGEFCPKCTLARSDKVFVFTKCEKLKDERDWEELQKLARTFVFFSNSPFFFI